MQNWLAVKDVHYDQVERVELPDRWPWTAELILRTGERIRVWGIAASGARHRDSMAKQQVLVDALNAAIGHRRG